MLNWVLRKFGFAMLPAKEVARLRKLFGNPSPRSQSKAGRLKFLASTALNTTGLVLISTKEITYLHTHRDVSEWLSERRDVRDDRPRPALTHVEEVSGYVDLPENWREAMRMPKVKPAATVEPTATTPENSEKERAIENYRKFSWRADALLNQLKEIIAMGETPKLEVTVSPLDREELSKTLRVLTEESIKQSLKVSFEKFGKAASTLRESLARDNAEAEKFAAEMNKLENS